MTCQLSDNDLDADADADDDWTQLDDVEVHGALTACCSAGQLLAFFLFSYNPTVTTPSLVCLLVLLPLAVLGYLASEIYVRLAGEEEGGETVWSRGRGRRRHQYVAVRMDDERLTWLPRYDPLQSPRKDRVRPLFDDDDPRTIRPTR